MMRLSCLLVALVAGSTLSMVAGDPLPIDFSPIEMRLGFVPDDETAAENEGAANDYFGQFLMKPAETVRPAPHNQAAADDGYRSWTATFLTKERPEGQGRPLRIEIVARGIQSLYDNVTLEADDHGRLNLCAAPYFADPTGERDSTEAILRALDDVTRLTQQSFQRTLEEMEKFPAEGTHRHPDSAENRREHGVIHCSTSLDLAYLPVLYLPEGTYKVSDTLCYRHQKLVNTYGSEMNQQIRLRGDGVGRTVIRLIDGAPGFEEGARKPVVSFMAAEQTNVATSNYCEDLTIHTGRGNPGAVGLDFFANNSGAVRNVKIVSGDGAGFAGLQLGHANYSGVLIKHLEVEGFDHGLHIDSATGGMFAHAEDISVRGQRVAGVTVGAISLSLRRLQTKDVPVGLRSINPVGFTALVDSELECSGPLGIDRQAGALYVSKVRIVGFDDARMIDEWVHPAAFGAKGKAGMPRLAVEETPIYQSKGKASTGVRKFGARGDGIVDDSPSIQAAMNSGAAELFFEPGRYLLNRPVVVATLSKNTRPPGTRF